MTQKCNSYLEILTGIEPLIFNICQCEKEMGHPDHHYYNDGNFESEWSDDDHDNKWATELWKTDDNKFELFRCLRGDPSKNMLQEEEYIQLLDYYKARYKINY
jgi:hypothetical protein